MIKAIVNPGKLCLINGSLLWVVGFWGFAANQFAMHTGMTPIIAGLVFIVLGWRMLVNPTRLVIVSSILNVLLGIAFVWPFLRNFEQNDPWGMFRTGTEIISCLVTGILLGYSQRRSSMNKK